MKLITMLKGKFVPVLINYAIKHYAMKTYGKVTSSLYGSELSSSRSGRFTPVERTPGSHLIGGWVGPRSGPDPVKYRKILPLPGIEPRQSNPYPVAIPTELRWLLDNNHVSIITTVSFIAFLVNKAH
jgi:hypothetical protein